MEETWKKSNLRFLLKQQRDNFQEACNKNALSYALTEVFKNHISLKNPQHIAGYYPINSEVNPLPLLKYLAFNGHKIGLPKIENNHLSFLRWSFSDSLIKGCFDILEPSSNTNFLPDIILMPLLGFDSKGNRLGYGKGYYDNAITKLSNKKPLLKIGLAYDVQLVDLVPTEPHDQKLDWVITPTKAWKF